MDKHLKLLESQLRAGDALAVRKFINTLNYSQIPRRFRVQVSSIARRVGLENVSIRIMNKVVRPKIKTKAPATDIEISEYARCLLLIGSNKEAVELLKPIDKDKFPQALLYNSFAYVTQWNYKEALPDLRSYVANESIDDYQRNVGKLNLAAALIPNHHYTEAAALLDDLERDLNPMQHKLLLSNTYEVRAQAEIFLNHLSKAKRYLDKAASLNPDSSTMIQLILKKWEAVILWKKNDSSCIEKMIHVRKRSLELGFSEIVRDCDFYLSLINNNAKLFQHISHGTAFPNYSLRWQNSPFEKEKVCDEYLWTLHSRTKSFLELSTATVEPSGVTLKPRSTHYLLLKFLSSDFYRPFKLGEIFEGVFPGEFYNPVQSPQRVYMSISRLRKFLASNNLSLALEENQGNYRISPSVRMGIQVYKNMQRDSSEKVLLNRLKHLQGSEFNIHTVSKILNMSPRNCHYIMNWGKKQRIIQKFGQGKSTRYSWVATIKKAS